MLHIKLPDGLQLALNPTHRTPKQKGSDRPSGQLDKDPVRPPSVFDNPDLWIRPEEDEG